MALWASAGDHRSLHGLASRGSAATGEGSGASRQSRIRRQPSGLARVPAQSSDSAPRLAVASVPLHGIRAPLRSEALTDNERRRAIRSLGAARFTEIRLLPGL